jgi:hypothetical protein
MAEIQAGTIFAAIAPNTDVDKKSALINEKSLTYTIEDIAAAVGSDVDLSAYLTIEDAEDTYQTIAGMSSYLTSADAMGIYQPIADMTTDVNDIVFGGTRTDVFFYATQDVFANNASFLPSQTRNQRYGTVYFDSNGYTLAANSVMYITLLNNTILSNSVVLITVENSQPLNVKFTVTAAVNAGQVTFAIYMDKVLDSNRGLGIKYAVM